jgi:phosphopantothenoylcysteine decarboxylase/phosphopantothenate--cysteine ligase
MHDAVLASASSADAIVMAAAVADYQPEERSAGKIVKGPGGMVVTLKRTPDILAALGAWRAERGGQSPALVGFAAETGDPVPRAREKLRAKRVDFIVANDVLQEGAGFEVDTNIVTLVGSDWSESLPLQPKAGVASAILDRVESLLERRPQSASPIPA